MLQMMPAGGQGQQGGPQGMQVDEQQRPAHLEMNPDGTAKNPAALMAHIKGNAPILASIEENNPRLAK